jgi:hypothetical protein
MEKRRKHRQRNTALFRRCGFLSLYSFVHSSYNYKIKKSNRSISENKKIIQHTTSMYMDDYNSPL